MLYAVALGAVLQNAEAILGAGHHEVARFNRACPDAKHARDVASHPEAYAVGQGRLQKSGRARAYTVLEREKATGNVTLHLFGLLLDVEATMTAARLLADAAHAADGRRGSI